MTAWRLDSSSDRMWALRPKPLPAEFPSQAPSPQPYPQVCSFSSSRPGPQACRSQGKEAATQSPKAPAHYVPYPGCVRTLPHGRLPWAPVLACSTILWPKGFSLRISDFIAPNPGLQPHQALELGHTWGLLTLPTHLYSQPGLCPPSTQT